MFYHTNGGFLIKGHGLDNKKAKKALVKKRRTHEIIVYSRETPVGWVQYGPKPELPRLDTRKNRRRGVAGFGLNAVLAPLKKKVGGLVEPYPSTNPSNGSSLMWSWTVSMVEDAGFGSRLSTRQI